MIKILDVKNSVVTYRYCDEKIERKLDINLLSKTTVSGNSFDKDIINFPVLDRFENCKFGFKRFGDENVRKLWVEYYKQLSKVNELNEDAVKLNVSTEGKTVEQIAKDIIQADCIAHNFEFKL